MEWLIIPPVKEWYNTKQKGAFLIHTNYWVMNNYVTTVSLSSRPTNDY